MLTYLPDQFAGMRIISDPNCLEETSERLFPASKNRSKRIHKKLVKRFGGEFRKEPAMFKIPPNTLVCHPALLAAVEQHLM